MLDAKGPEKTQVEAQLAALAGLTGVFDISPRGEVGDVDFKVDEKLAGAGVEVVVQSVQQALELAVAPFPSEPVGVGAKWERRLERRAQGVDTRTTHTFTLTEVSAGGGVVTADVALVMPKHPLEHRGVPPGTTEEATAKGAYRYAIKFDHIATKVAGEISVSRRIEVAGGAGGPQSVTEVIKLTNALEVPK